MTIMPFTTYRLKEVTIMAFASGKADTPDAQIARLRQQVDALRVDRVTPAVADFAVKAQRTIGDTTTVVRGQTNAISNQVRQRPWAAILIAAAVGWLFCRVTR
jgi:ElaB/YqjD/DUF883 family membrane-anchored ribosome-binding protein